MDWELTQGWMARVDEQGWRGESRLYIGRGSGSTTDYMVGVEDSGHLRLETMENYAEPVEPFGIWLPRGAVIAIGEAIKPGPNSAEVRRLEESLALERARVEKLIDKAVQG